MRYNAVKTLENTAVLLRRRAVYLNADDGDQNIVIEKQQSMQRARAELVVRLPDRQLLQLQHLKINVPTSSSLMVVSYGRFV